MPRADTERRRTKTQRDEPPWQGPVWPVLLALALVSSAAIAMQVALTRVLSITLWHHFAYLVVGIALLGFGVAGAWLAGRRPGHGDPRAVLARRARWAAFASLVAIMASLLIRPDALDLFRSPGVAPALALIIVLEMVPFCGIGLVLGTAYQVWPRAAGRLYAADLAGGGAGAALAVLALPAAGALGVLAGAVIATAVGALLLDRERGPRTFAAVIALGLCALALVRFEDAWIVPAPTKELALVRLAGQGLDQIEHRAWTADGRVDVTRAFHGPPLVAGDIGPPDPRSYRIRFVTQDGAAPTTMHRVKRDPSELKFLPRATTAAVWVLRGAQFGARSAGHGPQVLVIGVGGGIDATMALAYGAAHVDGIDVNPAIVDLHTHRFPGFTRLAGDPRVSLRVTEGRSFVNASRERWDVVQLAGVDTFTALAAGAYSLAEAHIYTSEAFAAYLNHLRPGGCLSVSRLILDPPRETLRLAVTAREALRERASPERHIAVVRGKQWATLLACDRPIAGTALVRLRSWADAHGFRLAYDPEAPRSGSPEFATTLQPDAAARAAFVADYPYRISPAFDEAPFFFNYFRWSNLPRFGEMKSGSVYDSPVPISLGVQVLALIVTALVAVFGIMRPLRNRGLAVPDRRLIGVYFACLGAGYLFVEVALIQRVTFFLGHPTYAFAVVLSALLVSSGIGAACSRWIVARLGFERVAMFLPGMLLLVAATSYSLLPQLLGLPFPARIAISLLVVAMAGLPLGIPFPHGIRLLEAGRVSLVPWVFGVNAFLTVVAASIAPLLAIETGFTSLLPVAAFAYVIAFLALRRVGFVPAAA